MNYTKDYLIEKLDYLRDLSLSTRENLDKPAIQEEINKFELLINQKWAATMTSRS